MSKISGQGPSIHVDAERAKREDALADVKKGTQQKVEEKKTEQVESSKSEKAEAGQKQAAAKKSETVKDGFSAKNDANKFTPSKADTEKAHAQFKEEFSSEAVRFLEANLKTQIDPQKALRLKNQIAQDPKGKQVLQAFKVALEEGAQRVLQQRLDASKSPDPRSETKSPTTQAGKEAQAKDTTGKDSAVKEGASKAATGRETFAKDATLKEAAKDGRATESKDNAAKDAAKDSNKDATAKDTARAAKDSAAETKLKTPPETDPKKLPGEEPPMPPGLPADLPDAATGASNADGGDNTGEDGGFPAEDGSVLMAYTYTSDDSGSIPADGGSTSTAHSGNADWLGGGNQPLSANETKAAISFKTWIEDAGTGEVAEFALVVLMNAINDVEKDLKVAQQLLRMRHKVNDAMRDHMAQFSKTMEGLQGKDAREWQHMNFDIGFNDAGEMIVQSYPDLSEQTAKYEEVEGKGADDMSAEESFVAAHGQDGIDEARQNGSLRYIDGKTVVGMTSISMVKGDTLTLERDRIKSKLSELTQESKKVTLQLQRSMDMRKNLLEQFSKIYDSRSDNWDQNIAMLLR